MGLLTIGDVLSFEETRKYSMQARRRGIEQFIRLFTCFKSRNDDAFKFGDEIEFSLVRFDHERKRVYLLRRADELLKQLKPVDRHSETECEWSPEFGNYMLEAMPARPYEADLVSLLKIEPNMRKRREQVRVLLDDDEAVMTFSTFPLIGSPDFLWPRAAPTPGTGFTSSLFFPDEAIFPGHQRYAYSALHIRLRRKIPRGIQIPIYRDINTPRPFHDQLNGYGASLVNGAEIERARTDHIYLDNIGASCSCLQVTFQARNLNQARHLYDQLIPLTPIILAMTASSPIWRGYLTDVDVRWQVMSESLDDRTPEETGDLPLKNDRYRLLKSRYDSATCYLSESSVTYNDVTVVKDEEFYSHLINNGVDHLMAQHVSHLFTRDPIVLFRESIQASDESSTDLFDNIQATNWQSVRFKPPPVCDESCAIGWRVEFRTAELQITDFENAAFVVFLSLLVRAIRDIGVDFRVAISLVDENMRRAQKRDACLREKFHFRNENGMVSEMSLNEIINGSNEYPGLIPIIQQYLSQAVLSSPQVSRKLKDYLALIGDKASGKVPTTASLMRSLVLSHPKYKFDSVVSDEIAYDLMWQLNQISNQPVFNSLLP